jgi:hypothetical protein
MKIFLAFDKDFPVEKEKLIEFLNQNQKFIEFELYDEALNLSANLIKFPKTFADIRKGLNKKRKIEDRFFIFTQKQYDNNYFFYRERNLAVFSFYGWANLTNLPIANGVLYFIIKTLALEINVANFRHQETTGCVYDFLWDKRGIDAGMRQARFCPECLERLNTLKDKQDLQIFEVLKKFMNHLSEHSRWDTDILLLVKKPTTLKKRKPKNSKMINVFIASPSDTQAERDILLNSLEVKFRQYNHEAHCKFRIAVSGWEDLASQPGYPQDIINRVIDKSDFVIAIFKNKLGSPTLDISTGKIRSASGTVEELSQTLDLSNNKKPIGMAYFYSNDDIILSDNERERVQRFQKSIKNKMLYKEFTCVEELARAILLDLENNILEYIEK